MVKTRTKGYLVLVAVFLLGAASGGGASFAYMQKRHAAILRDDGGARRLAVLSRKLDLDPDQEARVGAILHDHRGQVDTEIRAVLRPDQQTRFDKLIEHRKDHGPGRAPR
jgi:hypothetical protein